MRFERGLTEMTMRLQAACEAKHVQRADFIMTTSAYAAGRFVNSTAFPSRHELCRS